MPESAPQPALDAFQEPAEELAEELASGEELELGELTQTGHWLGGSPVQCERVVTPTGNITVGRHQIWIGFAHVGRTIGVWADTTTIYLAYDRVGGPHFKTVPSRLSTAHLHRLRAAGASPAGPPPVSHTAARGAVAGAVIEIDRVVNTGGLITLGSRHISVGQPLAGQRITLASRASSRTSSPTGCWPAPSPHRCPRNCVAACTEPASPPPSSRPPRPRPGR